MLPYFPQPAFSIGPFRVYAWALLAVAALLIARWIVLRRARGFGIAYQEIAPLYLTIVITGLAGAVVGGLASTRGGIASIGAIAGACAGGFACSVLRRWSWARMGTLLDIAAFASPFAGAIGRLGCTLAHEHRGLPSQGWFAFQFPEGARYDLGFIDLLFLIALCILFLVLDRKPREPLFFFAIAGTAYGAFRLWRETLDLTANFAPWAAVCALGIAALLGYGCVFSHGRALRIQSLSGRSMGRDST